MSKAETGSIQRLYDKSTDQLVTAILLEDWEAVGPLFDRGERLFNLLCCAQENQEHAKGIKMESTTLSNLEQEHSRLMAGRNALKKRADITVTRLLELENSQPALMVAVAVGVEPAEKLDDLNAEIGKLHQTNMEPLEEALVLVDNQLSGIRTRMANERARLVAAENREKFYAAREEIAAKGEYSALEIEHLEHLATVAGTGEVFRRFKAALDEYIFKRESSQNRADFPAFEYVE